MSKAVENIKIEISRLPQSQLKQFREWYEQFDSNTWGKQIEEDISSGKLDALVDVALADHKAGKSKRL